MSYSPYGKRAAFLKVLHGKSDPHFSIRQRENFSEGKDVLICVSWSSSDRFHQWSNHDLMLHYLFGFKVSVAARMIEGSPLLTVLQTKTRKRNGIWAILEGKFKLILALIFILTMAAILRRGHNFDPSSVISMCDSSITDEKTVSVGVVKKAGNRTVQKGFSQAEKTHMKSLSTHKTETPQMRQIRQKTPTSSIRCTTSNVIWVLSSVLREAFLTEQNII